MFNSDKSHIFFFTKTKSEKVRPINKYVHAAAKVPVCTVHKLVPSAAKYQCVPDINISHSVFIEIAFKVIFQ
jgi:hypothetical protein